MTDNTLNQENVFEEIHIDNFPKNMYVKLPYYYRTVLFQLIFLEFKNTKNLQKFLRKNNMPTNIIRWHNGKDGKYNQLINLDSLIFLRPYAVKRKNKILRIYKKIKRGINLDKERVVKSDDSIFLIKEVRYIFRGYDAFAKILCINPGILKAYVFDKKIKRIPSRILIKVLEIIEKRIIKFTFSPKELESKILTYKAYHGKEIFPEFQNERKLPIKINPEFESILYHLMGDGHVSEIGSSEYTQLNELAKNNFLEKLFRVFGYFNYSQRGLNNGRVYISKTIIQIICDYYGLNSNEFKWNISKLPKICLARDSSFKLAGLIAFIVDEGYVGRSGIFIHSSNKFLLTQIKELAQKLGIYSSEIKLRKGRDTTKDSFKFYIFKKSVIKFSIKTEELEKIYLTCNLAQKKEKVLRIAN